MCSLGMATRSAGASALQQHGRARGPGGADAQPCRAGLAGGGFGSPSCWVLGVWAPGGPGPGSHPPVAAQRMAPPSSASSREDGQGRRARPAPRGALRLLRSGASACAHRGAWRGARGPGTERGSRPSSGRRWGDRVSGLLQHPGPQDQLPGTGQGSQWEESGRLLRRLPLKRQAAQNSSRRAHGSRPARRPPPACRGLPHPLPHRPGLRGDPALPRRARHRPAAAQRQHRGVDDHLALPGRHG